MVMDSKDYVSEAVQIFVKKGLCLPVASDDMAILSRISGDEAFQSYFSSRSRIREIHSEDPVLLTSLVTHASLSLFEGLLEHHSLQVVTPSLADMARRAVVKAKGIDLVKKDLKENCQYFITDGKNPLISPGVHNVMEDITEAYALGIAVRHYLADDDDDDFDATISLMTAKARELFSTRVMFCQGGAPNRASKRQPQTHSKPIPGDST